MEMAANNHSGTYRNARERKRDGDRERKGKKDEPKKI